MKVRKILTLDEAIRIIDSGGKLYKKVISLTESEYKRYENISKKLDDMINDDVLQSEFSIIKSMAMKHSEIHDVKFGSIKKLRTGLYLLVTFNEGCKPSSFDVMGIANMVNARLKTPAWNKAYSLGQHFLFDANMAKILKSEELHKDSLAIDEELDTEHRYIIIYAYNDEYCESRS